MYRDDTEQVTARNLQGVTSLPAGHLDRAQPDQPVHFSGDIIGFDVDVVPGSGVDCLHRDDQIRDTVLQRVELRLSRRALGRNANAVDQNAALAAASPAGASISKVDKRLRCIGPRLSCIRRSSSAGLQRPGAESVE